MAQSATAYHMRHYAAGICIVENQLGITYHLAMKCSCLIGIVCGTAPLLSYVGVTVRPIWDLRISSWDALLWRPWLTVTTCHWQGWRWVTQPEWINPLNSLLNSYSKHTSGSSINYTPLQGFRCICSHFKNHVEKQRALQFLTVLQSFEDDPPMI